MKLATLIVALALSFAQLAFADDAKPTGPIVQYDLRLAPNEVEKVFQGLHGIPRPDPEAITDPIMLKIQQQVADQNKAQQELNAKAHAEAVQKDEKK